MLGAITGLLLLPSLVHGFRIRSQDVDEMSSRNFHAGIALGTVVAVSAMTLVAVIGVLRPV